MKLVKYILSLPKTFLFNFKVFPFKTAIKLPVLIAYNVKVTNIHKGCIKIDAKIERFMVSLNINSGSRGVSSNSKGYLEVGNSATIIFKGNAIFASGTSIRVDKGIIIFGKNFNCNKNCFFACSNKISMGDNVLVGWNVNIRDSDGHSILKKDSENSYNIVNKLESVTIGNHVWIASCVDILKGVIIPNNCIVGYRSCLVNKFHEKNCIIAGYPAKVVRRNVIWSE